METKKNTSTKTNEKMTKPQKVIVILTAVVLAIILIVFAATRYMGSPNTYPIDSDVTTSETTRLTVDSQKDADDSNASGNISDGSDDSNVSNNGQNGNQDDNSRDDGKNPDIDNRSEDGDNYGKTDEKPSDSEPDHSGDNDTGNGSSSDNGGNNDADEEGKPDDSDSNSDGIRSGDSVTIASVSESTVTVTVGNEAIVIPVQTTIFNGRITKSGVISDSLCGYSIGASVMLYYPEGSSLSGATLTGAYIKADSTRLTVSGDYNGDGSKIVFRINGVRLP